MAKEPRDATRPLSIESEPAEHGEAVGRRRHVERGLVATVLRRAIRAADHVQHHASRDQHPARDQEPDLEAVVAIALLHQVADVAGPWLLRIVTVDLVVDALALEPEVDAEATRGDAGDARRDPGVHDARVPGVT